MPHLRARHHAVRMVAVAALLSLTGGVAAAQSTVAGHWTLTVDSPQGDMTVTLALAVDGDAVKGNVSTEFGDAAFTGALQGAEVTFSFDLNGPQGPMTVKTKGTVTGDAMKGEMDYGMGVAPFTGKRAEP